MSEVPLTLFDDPRMIRDRAIARADVPKFTDIVVGLIQDYIVVGARFTTDDIWQMIDEIDMPKEGRAMGPAMLKAEGRGLCKPTAEFVPTRRKRAHMSPQRVWIRTGRG